jgi:hypothetical protein
MSPNVCEIRKLKDQILRSKAEAIETETETGNNSPVMPLLVTRLVYNQLFDLASLLSCRTVIKEALEPVD